MKTLGGQAFLLAEECFGNMGRIWHRKIAEQFSFFVFLGFKAHNLIKGNH